MRHLLFLFSCLITFVGCKTGTTPSQKSLADSSQSAIASPVAYPQGGSEKLYATAWAFTEAGGITVANGVGGEAAELAFFPGQVNRVNGSTGCNRLNGTFALAAGNAMTFSPLATTRKMCPNGNGQEQRILTALQGVTRFAVINEELILLRGDKVAAKLKRIAGSNKKAEGNTVNDEQLRALNDELLRGIDFKANGNEPFWSLQIDLKKGMTFRFAGGDSVNTPPVAAVRLQDAAASSYRVQTEKGLLTVIVYDKPCVNDMSGQTLPKTVNVTYNGKKYNGCGTYLSDYRLNDIWILKSINDEPVDGRKLIKGLPQLELNLKENRVEGHTGCNGFGGRLEVTGRYLSFSRLAGTMMACDDGGFETRYYKLLQAKELEYEIADGVLTLHTGATALQYKKTD